MKRFFRMMMLVVAATMAFAACSQYEDENIAGPTVKVNVSMVLDAVRSSFDTPNGTSYPTSWDGDEVMKYALNLANASNVEPTFVDDQSATAELTLTDDGSGSYTIHALSPESAFVSVSASYKNWTVEIPATQTPTATSCDPAAQILYAVSNTSETLDASYSLSFHHATAYGKMTLKNLALNGAKISSVAITTDSDIAGRHYLYVESGTTSVNSGAKSITINTSSTENIWFACAPVAFTSLKVTVTTDKGVFTKQISASKEFKSGKIAVFAIDMTGVVAEKPAEYQLLTDVADLNVGDQVILANTEAAQAISSTQNSNNRGQAAVTIDGGCIVAPGDAVEIFEVEEGTQAGTFAFKATKTAGYIYAASSSSNYLRTEQTLSGNSSFAITISNGTTSIVAQGSNTRNNMRYNASTPCFSFYAATSTVSALVDVYYLPSGNAPATPKISASDIADVPAEGVQNATAEITKKNITSDVTVTKDGTVVTAASLSGNTLTYTVSANTGDAREGWIKLAADGAECTIKVSQVSSVVEYYVKVDKIVSGSQFLIVYNDQKAFTPLTSGYGYASSTAVTVENDKILRTAATKALEFVFTSTGSGYHMQDGESYYYYNQGTYKNYNRSTSAPTGYWTLTYNGDGTFKILFSTTSRWVQYDTSYNNFGCYDTATGVMPSIYQLNGTPIGEGGETPEQPEQPGGGEGVNATDVINLAFTGVAAGTNYAAWSGKTGTSGAVYAGNSAGDKGSVQLRSNNNNSGIVTTASAGKVSKITVSWHTDTANGRTLNVYGSNSAYTAASDLYDNSKQGTLLGTIVKGTSTELAIDGDYAYIGLRSNGSAMYLTEIQIVWGDGGETPAPVQLTMSNVTCSAQTENSLTFSWEAVANATGYQVSTDGGSTYGATQTATTYTWTGLSASTTKTIYVKAIGNGSTYTDSAAKSASGTTSAAQGGGNDSANSITLDFASVSKNVSDYTSTWEQSRNGYKWSITNFNNNNGGWTYIRCGRKNDPSVAYIDTTFSIPWAVASVTVTVDAVTTAGVQSTYLQVATDATFSNVVETVNVTIAKGDVAYNISNPGANRYYRLVYDCVANKNGSVQISKVVYSAQ